jgi:cell division ATPase FtsA
MENVAKNDKIKKNYKLACVLHIDIVLNDEIININGIDEIDILKIDGKGRRTCNAADLGEIVFARAYELFSLIKYEIERHGVQKHMVAGSQKMRHRSMSDSGWGLHSRAPSLLNHNSCVGL